MLQDGPAGMGGIRPGDVIAQVQGKPIGSVPGLLSAVAACGLEKSNLPGAAWREVAELELTPACGRASSARSRAEATELRKRLFPRPLRVPGWRMNSCAAQIPVS